MKMQDRGERKGCAKDARDLALEFCILCELCVAFLRELCG
jgi:hypothetical protein